MSPEKSDVGSEAASRHEADDAPNYDNDVDIDDREVHSNAMTAGQTKCSICQSTFRRPEHLKRHFRSHTKEKPFECAQCGRHFSRTDTLHRHELSHHTLGTEGGKDRTHRITVKTFRACFKCAIARVRCSGGTPCVRCENRSLECQYPTERRSKAKARKDSTHNLSLVTEDATAAQAPGLAASSSAEDVDVHRGHVKVESPSRPPEYQVGQFQLQLSGMNASSTPSNVSTDFVSREHPRRQLNDAQNNRRASDANHLNQSNHGEAKEAARLSFHSFSGVDSQHLYSQVPSSEARVTLSDDHGPRFAHNISGLQPGMPSSNVNMDIPASDNQQVPLGFAPPFLDQSMFSTINWLPNDLLLDTTSERSLASRLSSNSFQAGALDGALDRTAWLPPAISMGHSPSLPENIISHTPSGNASLGTDGESPEKYAREADQNLPLHSESSAFKRPADYYAAGIGARLPKYRRRQGSWSREHAENQGAISLLKQTDANPRFSFPIVQGVGGDPTAEGETIPNNQLAPSTYDIIYKSFLQLCCTENFLYPKFESDNFPSTETFSSFIQLYFNFFQPVYPIFHPNTFDPNKCHWLVAVAVLAVGCHIADFPERDECASAFHEFLRRALNVEKEKHCADQTPPWLLQALTLNHIGLLHGNHERTRVSALSSFGDLVNLATRERLLCSSSQSRFISSQTSPERQWAMWVEDEVRRRTGYLVWLLDCTLAYHFDSRPLLSLDDGLSPLPSHESLWQAKSASAWKQLFDKTLDREEFSLYDAVLIMYIEKKLVPNIGEFSHILLIHALYHRMWEVGDYFRRPLSFWNPTAKKQPRESAIPSGSVWLPGIPSYSKWRNSACDCLDILHWTANGTIAKAAGFEHPTIMHLHEARIVLLAPFHEIRALATSLVMGNIRWGERRQATEWHYILRWIKHDQYKARLAVIHSGSCLWHVRRYSTNAFHEPVTVFLAILTLWAYGLCHSQASPETGPRVGSRHNPPRESTLVQIDHPCGDELVQLFVREGQKMRGNLTGVGDICGPQGPERILRVGCETLASVNSWGISKRFIAMLATLADLMSREQMVVH